MESDPGPHVELVEKMDNAVIVTFTDGRSVLYRAALLLSIIPQAQELTSLSNPDDDLGHESAGG